MKKNIKQIKQKNNSRCKQVSVVIQPNVEADFWLQNNLTDKLIEEKLMQTGYPLHTEIKYALESCAALSSTGKGHRLPVSYSFGTETSVTTKIPHYQCWISYSILIRRTSVFEFMKEIFGDRVHIAVKPIFGMGYKNYCLKETSKFEFQSFYYWNVKIDSKGLIGKKEKLKNLRGKLEMISKNYYSGQKLLKKIVESPADDRSMYWIADVVGGTGKTGFFQTIIDDADSKGLYLRISEGQERLSAKLRKKITARLENKEGYPKFIWVNFGRTVTEQGLQMFSDFGEQIVDGMLDDNFANTGGKDFIPLPYINLVVTANTPPNMHQLTGDRIKLMTFFPICKGKIIEDTLLIPIFVEIKVKFPTKYPNNVSYKYVVRLQDEGNIKGAFSEFPWYGDLIEQVKRFQNLVGEDGCQLEVYEKQLHSYWRPIHPNKMQEDILAVYYKCMEHLGCLSDKKSFNKIIEGSSFNYEPKLYLK